MKKQLASKSKAKGDVELISKFKEDFIEYLKNIKKKDFSRVAYDNYLRKSEILKPEYVNINTDSYFKWLYRVYYNKRQVRSDDPVYKEYIDDIKRFDLEEKSQQQKQQPSQYQLPPPLQQTEQQGVMSEAEKFKYDEIKERLKEKNREAKQIKERLRKIEKERDQTETKRRERLRSSLGTEGDPSDDSFATTGSGLGNNHITCPNNVIADVDKLEILIGGRRAGNTSHEITNEISDICRRLFTSGIMDINTYREFIDEITDD